MTTILVLTNLYPPHHLGGYELACRDVVERWRDRGHRVEVLTSTMRASDETDDPMSPVRRELQIALNGSELVSPPLTRRRRIERRNQAALARAMADIEPEVVSVWSMGAMSTGLLTTLHRSAVPLVYVVSDDWPTFAVALDPWMRMFRRAPRRLAGALEPAFGVPTVLPDLGQTGTFCFISEVTRRRCERQWSFPDATVTWSGIDLHDFPIAPAPPDPRDGGGRPWAWHLLHVGRLDPRKGTDVAIRSLAHLPAETTLAILSPVDDPYRHELQGLADRLGVAPRVTFATSKRADLGPHYRAADALLFPTVWDEPFGYVPLEAMASGTPVVATGTGGSGEFLIDGLTCLRCRPGDPVSLASSVRRLAGDAGCRQALVTAGRRIASELSVERWADILEAWHAGAAAGYRDGRPAARRLPAELGG